MTPYAGRAITRDLLTDNLICRLDCRVSYTDGCWFWMGARTPTGYGNVKVGKTCYYAHRLVYALAYGETPAGVVIRHACDNPACVRPDHLIPGTQAENQRDMALRDRCGTAKITNAQARMVVEQYDHGIDSRVIAAEFGIARSTVYNIARGVTRFHATGRGRVIA